MYPGLSQTSPFLISAPSGTFVTTRTAVALMSARDEPQSRRAVMVRRIVTSSVHGLNFDLSVFAWSDRQPAIAAAVALQAAVGDDVNMAFACGCLATTCECSCRRPFVPTGSDHAVRLVGASALKCVAGLHLDLLVRDLHAFRHFRDLHCRRAKEGHAGGGEDQNLNRSPHTDLLRITVP